MVGSAVQNGMRLIVVVNGLDDPDDRASNPRKCLNGDIAISKRGHCSPRSNGRLRQGVWRESRSVKLRAPNRSGDGTEMAPTNDRARGLHGPVRAPVESGQQVGLYQFGEATTSRWRLRFMRRNPSARDRRCGGRSMGERNSSSECFALAPRI